ncbi:disp [Symbiodinium sp. CCMP2456]|nr:disp [Symbiodinium sp. CCMP2456]
MGSAWPPSRPKAPTAIPPHWTAQTAGYNPAGDPLLGQSFGQSFGGSFGYAGTPSPTRTDQPASLGGAAVASNDVPHTDESGALADHGEHVVAGGGGHDQHHHEMWLVQSIQASPWRFYFGGFCCLLSCFLLIAVLLLLGVPILDPRPNDIVPVILREHIAKKRQDAGRSLKEVALACPGCEDLMERSERMFYLHIIYEVEHESGTLWEADILQSIHEVEQKVFEAKGLGPDGKEWAFEDMCLLAKPNEELKGLGRELPKTPKCAFALSPLLFLADKVLPLADPPPFQLKNLRRTGYLWINESHHQWTDHLTRCVVPPEEAQKEEMEKVTGSWFMRKATEYYDNRLGQDPSEDIVDDWCSAASSHLPPEMRNCGCLALIYNDVQMAQNWDISLQQMWDFKKGFQKLKNPEASSAYVAKVLDYWTSYDDDSVELCRRNSEKCPWKNADRRQDAKFWSNQACSDAEHMERRRRHKMLKSQTCGDNAGHAFYARRRVLDRVVPHPFVMAAWALEQLSVGVSVPTSGFEALSWAIPFIRAQGFDDRTASLVWWLRVPTLVLPRGQARLDLPSEEELVLFPKKFPVGDDDAGSCKIRDHGTCTTRNTQVKSLHTLFFFGFPLKNVNEHWSGLKAETGRNEASEYIMEWIFSTYNDLLVDLNAKAKGGVMSFDANSLQNGSPLLKQYIAYNIPRDARWITASIFFMLGYISYTTGSVFLGEEPVHLASTKIIAMIVFAFGPALLLYTMVFGQRYIGLLHLNGLFIILGVGVDDAFVIMDAYGQEKAEAEAEGRPTNFSAIMSPAVHHASKACLCTSLTTFFAFASNSVSDFPSIRTFGMFCACLIVTNFFIDFSFFLAIVCASERLKKPKPPTSAAIEEADTLRPMEKWFHDTFFLFVKTFKFPLLGVFGVWAAVCMWTATYVTPDPNMPKVFMPSDNYERFLPTLAKRYEKTFNPFRLKVRIHLGVDADDPINRGTTPDYNDCFFNCAGQKPNYVDLFATAGPHTPESKSKQMRMQKVVQRLCDMLEDASEWDGDESRLSEHQREYPFLRVASAEDLAGLPPVKCVFRDFEHWIVTCLLACFDVPDRTRDFCRVSFLPDACRQHEGSNFCCGADSDFVKFLSSPMPPSNKMYQSGQRNMEFFQDEVFFDRVDGELVLRAIVIEVALKTTWQIPYLDGIELNRHWDKFVQEFAAKQAKDEMLPKLPKAIFATDMFAFHWFQVQDAMNSEVFDGIKLSLFLAFLVLLGATQNVFLALISVSCIVAIVSSVLAFAVCMDWKTSVSEAIIYVMVIGLSVDYVIHLGDAYLECPDESREDRVQFMVTKMGVSVISGAISSAGAAIFMTFCQSLFLIKFGIVICFVISVSVVTSLVFFSALLLVAGPSGESGSLGPVLRLLKLRKPPAETEEDTSQAPPEEPQKVQPRLYSSVVRYRKSLARASMANADARELARELGADAAPQEVELTAVSHSPAARQGAEMEDSETSRPVSHEESEVVDLRDLRE